MVDYSNLDDANRLGDAIAEKTWEAFRAEIRKPEAERRHPAETAREVIAGLTDDEREVIMVSSLLDLMQRAVGETLLDHAVMVFELRHP